jgi:Carboxypeptidase regulatory-like domain
LAFVKLWFLISQLTFSEERMSTRSVSTIGRRAAIWLFLSACIVMGTSAFGQSTGGRILGRVADSSGAVLPGVTVTLTNQETGILRDTKTNDSGDYIFVEVPPATYEVDFEITGFKKNVQKNVIVDINAAINLNSTLQIGAQQESVEVTSEAPLVDTTSTQMGAIVDNRSVNELPLNQRDTYQFLQLQPGVQSQLGSSGSTFYGSDAAGSVSVNGGRGRANNFSVNGGDANDQFVNAAAVQPTPDSIEEFRVITNTFDAEYGRNSGAVVNVVTKSGTNAFHGNVYEYFRNAVLNSQGYFNTVKPQSNQNQFGGTFGGPIIKNRTFFFGSYEGRRVRQGISGQTVAVPTGAERTGDFSAGGPFSGAINDQFVADTLNGRPGCSSAINALGGLSPAAGESWADIFPTAQIPIPCMDPVALNLSQIYFPAANRPDGTYQGVPVSRDDQDQFTFRFDHRINDKQSFTGYYYFLDERKFDPFDNFQASGANIPGFGGLTNQRFQQWNLSHTWTLSSSIVNEARFTYLREGQLTFQHPETTGAVQSFCTGAASAFCFTGTSDSSAINAAIASQGIAPGKAGITPGLPTIHTGLPLISISGGAEIGNNYNGDLPQVGNSFQWSDSFSWVKGTHTMKFGADVRRSRFDQTLYYNVNGYFTFGGANANAVVAQDNYPDYYLGLADQYSQGSAQREDVRNTGVYLFAQDSWKIKPNVTFNYGLRWELDTPLTDIAQHVQTFRPGQSSTVYPCTNTPLADCPTGLVVPGDKGVPAGLTTTYYKAFAPRVGLAYSPNSSTGIMGKLFGGPGKTSIRTGWGLFYNPIEQLVLEQFGAEPPFGSSPIFSSTFFNTPFVGQNGIVGPNGFNGILDPARGQDPGWSNLRPILLYGEFQPHLRTQYTAQYNFNISRELARDLVWNFGYVGSQGHRLLASHDINPSNPQTCLDINAIQGAGTCGPFGEDAAFNVTVPQGFQFHLPSGSIVTGAAGGTPVTLVGLRPYSSPNCNPLTGANCPTDGTPVFASIFAEDTIANSAYNSFQTMLEKRFSHGVQLQASYTFSKSIDQASSFEETLNPFNPRASRSLSLFNSAQRFVINYYWELPVPKYAGFKGRLLDDWSLSGITQFQSGFPIRLQTQDDSELINSIFFFGAAAPQLAGPLQILNPKTQNNHQYLNPAQFSDPPLGTFATTPRTICCGPGLNDTDITISKRIVVNETKYFQFRTDIFNIANKTQFNNPDGNFSDSTFGQIQSGRDPRLIQFALKFYF